jgi:hypothetical protein
MMRAKQHAEQIRNEHPDAESATKQTVVQQTYSRKVYKNIPDTNNLSPHLTKFVDAV